MAEDARGRARSGLGSWVRSVGQGAGRGLRKASPYGIYAFLTAAAVAPLAGPALGAAGEFEIALNQLGGMGGNHIATVLADTAGRLRERGGEVTDEQWREAVAEALAERLTAPDRADELVAEVRAVLRAVDGVEHAIAVSAEHAEELHRDLHRAVAYVGGEFGDVRWMLGELRDGLAESTRVLAELQREVIDKREKQRSAGGLTHRVLIGLTRSLRLLRTEAVRAPNGPCPYPGLAGFDAAEAHWFHGRDAEVAELTARVAERTGQPLVVTGASGVGKSSLVRAGLLPALAAGEAPNSAGWPTVVFTPGSAPLRELTARVASVARVSSSVDPAAFAVLARQAALTAGDDARLVIVVDQFEQLFTQCADSDERVVFAEALAAAGEVATVVVVVRADFFDRCVALPALVPALSEPWVLGAMGESGLREAITEPAERVGLAIEPGLVDRLLDDLGDLPGEALPLLAHALRATWDRRGDTGLTLAAYQATSGISGAVAATAETVYTGLDEPGRLAVRMIMPRLVTVVGERTLRRRADRATLPADVVAPWIGARLLTADEHTVQLSHEALITAWPRLRDWVAQDREDIATRQRLDDAAREWTAQDRSSDALLRGAPLAGLLTWADGRTDLSPVEDEFLATSAWTQARATRRLRALAIGLAVALLASLAATGIAVVAGQRADASAAESRSRQFAAESRLDAESDPISAMRKALQAWRESPTPQARGALLSAQMLRYPVVIDTGLTDTVLMDLSPDGSLAAVGTLNGQVEIWDTASRTRVHEIPHIDQVSVVRFSPDGALLATTSAKDGLRIWNVPDWELVQTLPGFSYAAWRPDGQAIAAMGIALEGKQVQSWEPRTGKPLGDLSVPTLDMSTTWPSLLYTADASRIVIGRSDGVVEFWDTATGELAARRTEHRDVDPDAEHLVYAVATTEFVVTLSVSDERILLRDPATGAVVDRIAALSSQERDLRGIAVHQDGDTLLTTGGPGRVSLYHIPSRSYQRSRPGMHDAAAFSVALSGDGATEAALSSDGRIWLWRVGTNWYTRLTEPLTDVAFNRLTAEVAAIDAVGNVDTWDLATGQGTAVQTSGTARGAGALAWTPGGELIVADQKGLHRYEGDEKIASVPFDWEFSGAMALSQDGQWAATAMHHRGHGEIAFQYRIAVWDTRTLTVRATLAVDTLVGNSLAFDPSGATLFGAEIDIYASMRSWSTEDFSPLWERSTEKERIVAAAFTPDGTLLTAGMSGVILVRNPDDGAVLDEFGEHPSGVRELAVSPDGALLAVLAVDDSAIRLWDLRAHTQLADLVGHWEAANDAVFSSDGSVLITAGSVDTDVAMWRVRPEDAIARICANLAAAGSTCHDPADTP